jgi:hypothetical protein
MLTAVFGRNCPRTQTQYETLMLLLLCCSCCCCIVCAALDPGATIQAVTMELVDIPTDTAEVCIKTAGFAAVQFAEWHLSL